MTDTVWSTFLYCKKINDHEAVYKEFLPYLEKEEYFGSTWTFGDALSSIRSGNNDALPWGVFFDKIKPHVQEYLESLEPTCAYQIHTDEFWVNCYRKNNFQEPHDHAFPGRGLSAVYVMEMPQGDNVGGELVLECPHFNIIKSSGLNRIFNKWQYQHLMPNLEPGTLIIFPSWVTHYVLPSKTDERRTTIAVNFCIGEQENDQT